MGINGGSAVLWKTVKLPIDQALKTVQKISSIEQASKEQEQHDDDDANNTTKQRMKIAIDANLVGYKHVGDSSSFQPANAVTHVAKAISDKLVDVVIGSDHPTVRHPSKRATCKRTADVEKAEIQLPIAGRIF